MRFQKTPTKMSGRSICWLMTSCASAPTPVREACGWPGDEGSHVQPFARRHMQACGVWCQPLLSLCGQVRYLRVVPHQHVPIHSAFSRPGLSPLCEPAPRYLGCIDHQHPSHDRPLPQRSARRQGSPVRNSTESLKMALRSAGKDHGEPPVPSAGSASAIWSARARACRARCWSPRSAAELAS
jgi:hypothetical protein